MPTFVEQNGAIRTETTIKDRVLVEKRVQDVEPVLNANKALATDGDGYSPDRTLRRAASIPLIVVEQWLKEGVDIYNPDHAGEVKRRLNSADWLHLRTAGGRL